ncbi:MAG TPA: methionine--tRNA ligase subunit beta [bacterium]|nr:methionine--tRNA ligase subunit beta [bacterium]HPP12168.1 methionine--tRNA ligase subunit beta [bacterium]
MDISYEEFKKMDLRVGKVIAVEDHPNADRLYLITVDLGTEQRQMVAGIKPWYQKDQLIGRNVVVLTNLAPRNIRGVESHGMILASLANNQLAILTLDKDLPPGSPIS